MFVGVMTSLKMTTARSMVRTCLTFAAKRNAIRSTKERGGAGEKRVTSDGHRQRPGLLVRGEAHIVEPKRDAPVDGQRDSLAGIHLRRPKLPHAIELPARPAIEHALDERQRAHSHEQVERVEFQPPAGPGLEHVRHDGLERGEEGAKEREDEPPEGEVEVSVGRKADSGHDGNEGEELFHGDIRTDHSPRKDHCK